MLALPNIAAGFTLDTDLSDIQRLACYADHDERPRITVPHFNTFRDQVRRLLWDFPRVSSFDEVLKRLSCMPAYRDHCPKGILQVVLACYLMTAGEAVCETYGSFMERLYDRYTNTDDAGVRTMDEMLVRYICPLISKAGPYAKKIVRTMSEGYRYRKPIPEDPHARETEPRKCSWVDEGYRKYPYISVVVLPDFLRTNTSSIGETTKSS